MRNIKKGDRVIIKFNPHQQGFEKILATIVKVRKGAGHGGVDLIDITYPGILDDLPSLPLAPYNLEPTSADKLMELAKHYDEEAAYCRKLAQEITDNQ